MSPSGLIFLVIVGIWAAYFTQYWIRRREHLSTARTMDRFSESMRVLARRSPLPESALSSTTAGSGHPSILGHRAGAASDAGTMHSEGDRTGVGATHGSPGASAGRPVEACGPAVSPAVTRPVAPAGSAGSAGERYAGPVAEAPVPPHSLRPLRAGLGLLLVAAVLATVVIAILAPFTTFLWWAPVVPLLIAVVTLAALRVVVRIDRSHRRAAHAFARQASSRPRRRSWAGGAEAAVGVGASAGVGAAPVPTVEAGLERVADTVPDVTPAAELAPEPPADVPYGFEAPAAAASPDRRERRSAAVSGPAGPLTDEDDLPVTWDPRPVPRPTYTMKAHVVRPEPVATAAPAGVPAYVDEFDDDVDDVVPPRRRAVGD